ncbi:MAG: hypothetical protein HZA16_04200 [Nitrospirae bacterium]|nr:hypothetical protein [Nitrospirota bacterium]
MMSYTKTITLRDFLKAVFHHKLVFVIVPIAVMTPIYISSLFYTPTFRATVIMSVKAMKKASAEYYETVGFFRNPTTDHQELVSSNAVVERVVEALKLYEIPPDHEIKFTSPAKAKILRKRLDRFMQKYNTMSAEEKKSLMFQSAVEKLKGSISVDQVKDTNMFSITVSDFDPDMAVLQANAVSRSYLIYDLDEQIADFQMKYGEKHAKVVQFRNFSQVIFRSLDGKILPDMEAIGPASVKIMEQAREAVPVAGQSTGLFLALGFFGSMAFSVILVFVFQYTDNTFRSPHDVERSLNISVLGTIPKTKSKDLLLGNDGPQSDESYVVSYRNLSENIFLSFRNKNLKSILVADTEGCRETAFIICNIGSYLAAHHGDKVLIIDANLRSSSISGVLGIQNTPGIVDVLEGKAGLNDAIVEISPGLYVLPSGNTSLNPVAYLESSGMSKLMSGAKELFGMIFVSSPDLLNFTDATVLAAYTEGVAVVINEGRTRRIIFQRAVDPLLKNKTNIIGIIVNNRTYVIPRFIYKMT